MPRRTLFQSNVQDALDASLRRYEEVKASELLEATREMLSATERAALVSDLFFPMTAEAVRMRDSRAENG